MSNMSIHVYFLVTLLVRLLFVYALANLDKLHTNFIDTVDVYSNRVYTRRYREKPIEYLLGSDRLTSRNEIWIQLYFIFFGICLITDLTCIELWTLFKRITVNMNEFYKKHTKKFQKMKLIRIFFSKICINNSY